VKWVGVADVGEGDDRKRGNVVVMMDEMEEG
jgi:hypothetical protein